MWQPVRASISTASEVELQPGDYVAVRVSESLSANTLRAVPLARTTITEYADSEAMGHRSLASL